MKVLFTRTAAQQLREALAYIEERNLDAARRVSNAFEKSLHRISKLPFSCRATDTPGVRVLSLPKYPYLVFYSVDEDLKTVSVLRIRHMARNPAKHMI